MGRPRNISRAALRAYAARRRVLMALGFDSYELYLASDLWRRIRNAKLDAEGRICYGCGAPDCVQVHHGDYERPTLEGRAPHRLFVVCDPCHEASEFIGKTKLSPGEATAELRKVREKNLTRKCSRCGHRWVAHGVRSPCTDCLYAGPAATACRLFVASAENLVDSQLGIC